MFVIDTATLQLKLSDTIRNRGTRPICRKASLSINNDVKVDYFWIQLTYFYTI